MSSSILEDSKGEDDFHLLIDMDTEQESPQSSEEQQKILKKIFEEFKNKNNNQNNQGKKLCSSYVLKRLPNNKKVYSKTNPDGTTTETQVEKEPSGREKIIQTRYDKNNKVISRKVFYNINISNQNNNNNNQNNNNIQNNNNNNNNNHINNNNNGMNNRNRGHIFRAGNGFTIETKYEALPNGRKKEIKIIRDENDIVVDVQEDEIFENNYMNMNMNPNNMYRNNNMNSYMPMPMNNMMNNNMGGNMPMNNNGYNPMNVGMMNMNMGMMNMNMNMGMNNMNSMPPMMNNFGNPYMNMMMPMPMGMPMFMPPQNGVDPNILNCLHENEVVDASKMDPDSRNCVICLEDFKDKEKTIALPCIHVFHSECIKSWLGTHNCCPTCKFELTYQNINSHQM